MTQELIVQEITEVVANTTGELPALQAPLAGWGRKKLEAARAEYNEMRDAADTAKRHKWNPAPLRKAAAKALARLTFYEKVVAALDAGYMLFPPVPNADVIAIRTTQTQPGDRYKNIPKHHGTPSPVTESAEILSQGDGEYKSPVVRWRTLREYENTRSDNTKETRREWQALDLEDPEFPLLMGKSQIIEAVNAAQEMKVFDEIRMFPFERRRRGDPCILGSIVEASTPRRRLFFLISWRIEERDL